MKATQPVWRTAQSPPPPSKVPAADPPPTHCPAVRNNHLHLHLDDSFTAAASEV